MGNIIGTYAAYSKDGKLRLESSSGAVFSLLQNKSYTKTVWFMALPCLEIANMRSSFV